MALTTRIYKSMEHNITAWLLKFYDFNIQSSSVLATFHCYLLITDHECNGKPHSGNCLAGVSIAHMSHPATGPLA